MPTVLRSRPLRSPALPVVAAVALAVLVAPSARADEEEPPPAAGDVVVGELVQGFADPGPDDSGHPEHEDSGLLSWIETAPGESVRVPTEDLDDAEAGATLEVTLGDPVHDEAAEQGLEPAHEVLAAEVLAEAEPPTAPAVGPVNHPVTVVMLQPAGAVRDATTLAQVRDMVDGPVADFWEEQTGGAVTFGTVAGFDWTTQSSVSCQNPTALWQEAATRASWTGGPGKHLLVYVPADSPGCSYGLGTLGSGPSSGGRAYAQAPELSVIAHEFGHNLGLGHASQLQCDGVVDSGTCRVSAYYDMYDVMGFSWQQVGSLSAPHAARLGVLPGGSAPAVAAGAATAEYTLSPVAARTGTRAVRLDDADGDVYWLEYRTATGRDAWLATAGNQPQLQTGVLLRRAPTTGDDTALLLDGTPTGSAQWDDDLAVAIPTNVPLTFGTSGFRVTVLAANGTTARVEVSTGATTHPIDVAYQELGGAGALGSATAARRCGLRDGGCAQDYQRGSIYWSPATGARLVVGAIRARWTGYGAEGGWMGYPVGGEVCGLAAGGCAQQFQSGWLYWSAASGAHPVNGAIRAAWAARGWEYGWMGYPTGGEVCGLAGGGCAQQFQSGTVFWSPATGAHSVNGAIRARWATFGAEGGWMGYPVGGEVCGLARGGCAQQFQVGWMYWSPASGAQPVNGGIRAAWAARGWEYGWMGYPTSGEVCGLAAGGCLQQFQVGTVYWSPATGAHSVNGAIRSAWGDRGWEAGWMGYPTGGEVCGLRGGGCLQVFQGGSIYWSPATGAHVVNGAIRDAWGAAGWENGRLGYPVAPAQCGLRDGGCLQQFQGGLVYWSPASGAHPVLYGVIWDRYSAQRWEIGPLRYPVAAQVCDTSNQWGTYGSGFCTQAFQGGVLDTYYHVG